MNDRTLRMLQQFLSSDYPLRIDGLSELLNVSSRTIRNELKELNAFLTAEGLPEIRNSRGNGFQLTLTEGQKQQLDMFIRQENNLYLTREERIFDLILSLALGKEKVFLYQKEEVYLISKSSMDEDMRRVRAILQEYDIQVVSIPKQGVVLQGTERSIRTMIYDIISRFYGIVDMNDRSLWESQKAKILTSRIPYDLLLTLDKLYSQNVSAIEDDIYRNQLLLFTAIWLSRYQRQDMIAGSAWEDLDAPQTAIANFITAVCQQAAIEPPAVEIKYIRFMLGTFNAKDMQNSIEWVQAQLLSIQLIQFVERETKIPFSRKEELLQEGLYKHVASLIYRVKSDIQIVNPLKDNIKRNYTKLYTVIHRFIPKIERVAGNPLTEDEVAFLTIHFSTAVSALNQDIHYIYKAVVVCNHGTATGNLLAENLKELFNIEVLAVLSSRETDVIRKLDVDIVFATAPIANVEKPVLVLEPIIKEESQRLIQHFLLQHDECKRVITHASDSTELFYAMLSIIEASGGTISKEIYQKVESVFDTHHLRLNRREIQPMLKDVLTEKNIKLHDTVSSWEEAIARVAEPLLKEGVIEEHYIDAMIRSVQEYGPYIVIGPHLALAHARPEDGVNRLGVSVITLKEPINFGNEENDPVNIVFCLATVDSYSHLTIMKHLVALINDEDKLNQLCQLDDVTAFMELLFEE